METVEGRCAKRNHHDQDDTNNPAGQRFEQKEEGDGASLGRIAGPSTRPSGNETRASHERKDAQQGNCSHGSANLQILVRLGGKGSQPELGEEEVVGEDGDGKDVHDLPAQQAGLGEARGPDEAGVDVGLDADGDGGDDDKTEDHNALDDVCEEGDFEAADGWVGQLCLELLDCGRDLHV